MSEKRPPIPPDKEFDPWKQRTGGTNRKTVGSEDDAFWRERGMPPAPEETPQDT